MVQYAFKFLTKQYNFNNFKAIGHSNGGLIYTAFLENYYSEYSEQIKIKQLMTIGSPYNFNEKSVRHKTQMLSDFIDDRDKIPASLSVYSVAGTKRIIRMDWCLWVVLWLENISIRDELSISQLFPFQVQMHSTPIYHKTIRSSI
jgi:Uncharacterized protein with an alpha/beta hydrolase fold